jgi:2-phosphosulfolactate phosphatase
MTLDVAFSRRDIVARSASSRAAIVIDIIRASTTIAMALHNGCAGIIPVGKRREAKTLAATLGPGVLLAGERRAEKIAGFDLGNSPADFRRERVAGKTVIMTTTNGTRAFRALDGAREVIVCAFVNVSAVARWLCRAGLDVMIVCAGRRGRFCLEDAVGGGMLIDRLLRVFDGPIALSDAARASWTLFEIHRGDLLGMLRGCEWGRGLTEEGFGADLEVCAQVDITGTVPVMRDGRLVADVA